MPIPQIILASQSPSRREILSQLGYTFSVRPSNFNEQFDLSKTPQQNAMLLAEGKAKSIFNTLSQTERQNTLVIGVDTIIIDPNGKLLEKPTNRQNARDMMSTRSGQSEILISGICILKHTEKFSGYEETKLTWLKMNPEKIEKILDTNEWKGKCGGVAIEGFTGLHISKISGNYSNVMGFPVNSFLEGMSVLENS